MTTDPEPEPPVPGDTPLPPASDGGVPSGEHARWGDLLLLEPMGSGAPGEAWRAWDPSLEARVALEFLIPAAAGGNARLIEAGSALARVRDPNVVMVHGIAEHDGRVGLWTELLEGRTLQAEIESGGALSPAAVAHLCYELCDALAAVHDAGLVHGDVGPENIVLVADGRIVLTGFDLGRSGTPGDGDTGSLPGPPIFMAPERLAGSPATARCDLYSLGVTLHFALTALAPFAAHTLAELRVEARTGPARPLREDAPLAPESLVSTIERAMAPRAIARFASAREMAAGLHAAMAAGDELPDPRGQRKRALVLAAAAVLALPLAGWLAARLVTGGFEVTSRPARHAPAPPPADAGAYQVSATLVRRGGTGGFESLAPGDRVAPGDNLSLEFHSTREVWVYVVNEDEHGEFSLLFPGPMYDRDDPIAADSMAILPGTIEGREHAWTVTGRGGREHFLVVVSPEPVAAIEAEIYHVPAPTPEQPIRYASVAPSTIEGLHGVGGPSNVPRRAARAHASAFEHFQALGGRESVTGSIWVRQITLENRGK